MNSKNILCIAAFILNVNCCGGTDPKKDEDQANTPAKDSGK